MTLVADADIEEPIVRALKELQYDIVTLSDIGAPPRPDKNVMARVLEVGGVLLTRDLGIPSQAYAYQYAQRGLTVVILRWKKSRPKDWQEMARAILEHGDTWQQIAAEQPSVISVTRHRSRPRAWEDIPGTITEPSQLILED